MESRRNQRVPLKIKALPLEGGSTEPLETIEISAGGALFFGNPGVPAGSIIWIQLEPTNNTGLPLNIQLRVVRLVQSPDGTVTGFGAQWIRIFSQDSIEPLQLFLKRTLSITSGFIQTVPAGGEFQGPLYLYVFPAGYESAPSSGAAEPVAQPQPKPSGTQAIFAEVPLHGLQMAKNSRTCRKDVNSRHASCHIGKSARHLQAHFNNTSDWWARQKRLADLGRNSCDPACAISGRRFRRF